MDHDVFISCPNQIVSTKELSWNNAWPLRSNHDLMKSCPTRDHQLCNGTLQTTPSPSGFLCVCDHSQVLSSHDYENYVQQHLCLSLSLSCSPLPSHHNNNQRCQSGPSVGNPWWWARLWRVAALEEPQMTKHLPPQNLPPPNNNHLTFKGVRNFNIDVDIKAPGPQPTQTFAAWQYQVHHINDKLYNPTSFQTFQTIKHVNISSNMPTCQHFAKHTMPTFRQFT